jgi:teichoic acid transport system ATP-binding protein
MAATDTRDGQSVLVDTVEGDGPPPLSVVVQDLHVRFKVYEEHHLTFRELSQRGFRARVASSVHALRGVSFAIDAGDALGIVGSNGSGKSTLLRAIAGLQPPTSGTVLVRHKPHLLGVGSVLKPQLSGRRNIYLGALAMGLRQSEVDEAIDGVIEYSELGDAINRPLKTYSSGMRARLSFSIATIKTPEILLIDEALAVGDRRFRGKSLRRLKAIRDQANTIVMVTHNVGEIRRTCNRCIWLEQGEIRADGPADEVLALYQGDDDDDETDD